MVFHWSVSDCKSPQGLQDSSQYSGRSQQCCCLEGLNSSSLFSESLRTVPSAQTTIGTTVTLMFLGILSSQERSKYLSIFSPSFIFSFLFSFLFFIYLFILFLSKQTLVLFFWLKLGDPYAFQNLKEFYPSHFPGRILGYTNTIQLWSNFIL